ncbi:MAG: beta-propeller domain-containing protein [Actinomycetota bacterium]|nr:beta-propeller domain-containing protein [Actinomycetota bacterium]
MKLGRRIALVPAAVVLAGAGLGGTAGHSASGRTGAAAAAKASRLVPFRSCGDLLGYVKSQAVPLVGPWGFGGSSFARGGMPPGVAIPAVGATPTKGVDYSGTNVQEQGVDEPDLVKTNGTTLFAVAGGRLDAVDVSTTRPLLLDSLKLDGGWSHELLLAGDRLLVLSRGGYWVTPRPAATALAMPYFPAKSVLSEIDVSNPKALRLVRTLTLDGAYVDARLVGATARIVVSSQVPTTLPFEQPTESTDAALAEARGHNRAVVQSSALSSWLPTYRIKRASRPAQAARPLVQCRNVDRPQRFSGLGMLTVLTVDLAKGLDPVDSIGVMTDARILYASPDNLYVATERWTDRPPPETPTEPQPSVTTAIHRFDISDPTRTRYRGSGQVSGYLLNQWSLSEFDGVLRVVSTDAPAWFGSSDSTESSLTTLRLGNGALNQIGRVGNLGKGERVYAVRFVGPTAYVVTFKQVDPLYTVELADPARPRVLGELELPGYSAYLHPIGGDLLLGIGQDVNDEGRPEGTQLSLFDVSDLRHPTRLAHATLGQGWSESESDHHAFLFWPRTGLVVVPFDQRAVGYRVGRARGIELLGRITHPAGTVVGAAIRRSVVVGSSVFTVSDAGVASSSLATLAAQSWAPFPEPAPGPAPLPGVR